LKTRILAPRQVLAQVDQVLARKLSLRDFTQLKPLEEVVEALYQGRRYSWVGVHLAAGSVSVPQVSRGAELSRAGRSQMAVPIKIASRVLGALEVASDGENAFGYAERVLLKQVAARLARFLTSTGKVLLRRERERQNVAPLTAPETRGYKPASQKVASLRAAAGENRRS
jgi:GAF domain-containing protein